MLTMTNRFQIIESRFYAKKGFYQIDKTLYLICKSYRAFVLIE